MASIILAKSYAAAFEISLAKMGSAKTEMLDTSPIVNEEQIDRARVLRPSSRREDSE
jgi:hypothetical protein